MENNSSRYYDKAPHTKSKETLPPWNEPVQDDNLHWYIKDNDAGLVAGFVNKADAYRAWYAVNEQWAKGSVNE